MNQSKKLGLLAVCLGAAPALTYGAGIVGSKVDNFMLADQTGMGHELYYYNQSPAIVLVSAAGGDEASSRAAVALAKVRDEFKDKFQKR